MEVRVEAENGFLPDLSYIAVRIGEIQKQTLYDPKKVYRFAEARRFGKIDVYQRLGTCDLVWGTDQPELRICKIVGSEGDTGHRLKVHVSRPSATVKSDAPPPGDSHLEPSKQSSVAKVKETSAAAKRYLQEHDVEGILTGAMRALLKSMPEDAPGFLCNYITSRYAAKQEMAVPPGPPKLQLQKVLPMQPAQVVPNFAAYYGKFILPSRWHSFLPAFHERCAWPRAQRKPQIATVLRPEVEFKHKPSVASWTSPSLNNTLARRTVRLTPSVESLKRQAREIMIQASLNGTLEEALLAKVNGEGDSQEVLNVEWLRSSCRQVFLKASADGQLEKALRQAKVPATPEDWQVLIEFRRKARDVVIKASQEGTLEKALSEALASTRTPTGEAERLRAKACDTLLMAVVDGSLTQALAETMREKNNAKKPLSVEQLRAQAREILVDGNKSGSLARVLSDVSGAKKSASDVIDLRKQTCDLLRLAVEDGSLETALGATSKEAWKDVETLRLLAQTLLVEGSTNGGLAAALEDVVSSRDNEVDQLRMQVCDLLVQASQDNTLSGVLANARKNPGRDSKAELDSLRNLAYATLLKAVEDDSLPRALSQVRPKMMDIDQLRQQACSLLIQASQDESLSWALEEAKLERLQPTAGDIQTLIGQVCEKLLYCSKNGSLTRVIKTTAQDDELDSRKTVAQAPIDVKDLRLRVCDMFGKAYNDGSLEKALEDLGSGSKDVMKIRAQAREALIRGAEDGTLSSTARIVTSQEKPDIEVLRQKACDVFSQALLDGRLDIALKPQQQRAQNAVDLRDRAFNVFADACIDGRLKLALTEVAAERLKSENARRLPGAAQQVQIAWSNSPSVGTWLNRRRAKPPSQPSSATWMKKPSVGTWLQLRPHENTNLELDELRNQAREVFINACHDGSLSKILSCVPAS